MISYRLIALVCISLLLLSGVTPAQKREASKEIRSKLFKQLLTEDRDLRECIQQEEGGAGKAEEGTTVEEVDLNRDGVPEYEVGPSSPCACGMVNCSIYLYRQTPQGYESILEGASGMGIEYLKTLSNGYVDLRVDARNNAATYSSSTYKFDGKQYRETSSRIVDSETGESKPAYRRVQFKRGASSTTVQGKVSISMPDTYLIGARAGQVMTVQLTSARRSVRFMVMSSKTTTMLADNTRSWTGTLPEDGDYTILVDSDDKATYSMTITIK